MENLYDYIFPFFRMTIFYIPLLSSLSLLLPFLLSFSTISAASSGMVIAPNRKTMANSPLRQFSSVLSHGQSTVIFVPYSSFTELLGPKGESNILLFCRDFFHHHVALTYFPVIVLSHYDES